MANEGMDNIHVKESKLQNPAENANQIQIQNKEIVDKYLNSGRENLNNIKKKYADIVDNRTRKRILSTTDGDLKRYIRTDMQEIFNILYKHYESLGPNYKLTDEQKEVFRFFLHEEEDKFWIETALSYDERDNTPDYFRNTYKDWIIKREDFDNFVKEIGLDDNSISYHKSDRNNYEPMTDRASRVAQRWKANVNRGLSNFNTRTSNFLKRSNEQTGQQTGVPTGQQTGVPTGQSAGKKRNQSKKSKKSKKRRYSKRR
jgi:hypothetical protein